METIDIGKGKYAYKTDDIKQLRHILLRYLPENTHEYPETIYSYIIMIFKDPKEHKWINFYDDTDPRKGKLSPEELTIYGKKNKSDEIELIYGLPLSNITFQVCKA